MLYRNVTLCFKAHPSLSYSHIDTIFSFCSGDIYVHADLHGASSVVIKNPSSMWLVLFFIVFRIHCYYLNFIFTDWWNFMNFIGYVFSRRACAAKNLERSRFDGTVQQCCLGGKGGHELLVGLPRSGTSFNLFIKWEISPYKLLKSSSTFVAFAFLYHLQIVKLPTTSYTRSGDHMFSWWNSVLHSTIMWKSILHICIRFKASNLPDKSKFAPILPISFLLWSRVYLQTRFNLFISPQPITAIQGIIP